MRLVAVLSILLTATATAQEWQTVEEYRERIQRMPVQQQPMTAPMAPQPMTVAPQQQFQPQQPQPIQMRRALFPWLYRIFRGPVYVPMTTGSY